MIQDSQIKYLQTAATANGNGVTAEIAGYTGAIQVEVNETAGGTCTLALQASFDGTTWYAVGYQQIDNIAALARAVSNVSVTASMKHVYQILDPYPQLRAVISAIAGNAAVTVRAYCVPA